MSMAANTGLQHLQTTVQTEDRCLMVGKMKLHSLKRGPGHKDSKQVRR